MNLFFDRFRHWLKHKLSPIYIPRTVKYIVAADPADWEEVTRATPLNWQVCAEKTLVHTCQRQDMNLPEVHNSSEWRCDMMSCNPISGVASKEAALARYLAERNSFREIHPHEWSVYHYTAESIVDKVIDRCDAWLEREISRYANPSLGVSLCVMTEKNAIDTFWSLLRASTVYRLEAIREALTPLLALTCEMCNLDALKHMHRTMRYNLMTCTDDEFDTFVDSAQLLGELIKTYGAPQGPLFVEAGTHFEEAGATHFEDAATTQKRTADEQSAKKRARVSTEEPQDEIQ